MTAACYPRFEPQHEHLVQITLLKWTSLKHELYDGLNILSHPTAFQTLDQLTRLTRLEAHLTKINNTDLFMNAKHHFQGGTMTFSHILMSAAVNLKIQNLASEISNTGSL